MTAEFRSGSDWQGSSGPHIPRNVQSDDLWPHSTQGPAGKDVLADGLHPILAIGNDAVAEGRAYDSPVGVMVTYNAAILRAVMNVAPRMVMHNYNVANVLTYGAPAPATFETSLQIGMRVYVDDSAALAAGVTLSLSPLNDAGLVNVFAGWLWYSQTEDEDVGIGGGNVDAWPKTAANSLIYTKCDILLK